jgi:D-amino-acid dehydrogenase
MACGSGRYLADVMANKVPQISSEGLDISRYGGRVVRESGSCVQPAH